MEIDDTSPISDPEGQEMVDEAFKGMANNELRTAYIELQKRIDEVRSKIHFPPPGAASRIMLIHTAGQSWQHHGHRIRRDGTNYCLDHKFGTALSLVGKQHITGTASVAAALLHDSLEDVKGLQEEHLTGVEVWGPSIAHLRGGDPRSLKAFHDEVVKIVKGVTKVSGKNKEEAEKATLEKLLETMAAFSSRVGNVKGSDRDHNMDRMENEPEEKRKKKSEETYDIYVPLAHFMGVWELEEALVANCAKYLNEDLWNAYKRLVAERKAEYVDPYEDKILDQLRKVPGFDPSVEFRPLSLARLIRRAEVKKPLKHLKLEECEIDDHDPFHDIVVLVKDKAELARARGLIVEKFTATEGATNLDIKDLHDDRGELVRVFNGDFGGRLIFRVNDAKSEAISKRGVVARSRDTAPQGFREEILHALKIAKEQDRSLRTILRDEAFATKITCHTPANQSVILTEGATPLDFGGRIHSNIAIGAQGAEVCDTVWGENRRPVSLFEPLPRGAFVRVKSCINKGEEANDQHPLRIDPSWLLFVRTTYGREAIIKYLRQSRAKSAEAGRKYFVRLCEIFALPDEELMQALKKLFQFKNANTAMGRGDIDPLKAVESLYAGQREFKIQIRLPHIPQALVEFGKKLGPKINMSDPKIVEQDEATGIATFEVTLVNYDKASTTYDLLRTILKISNEGFEITLKPALKNEPSEEAPPGEQSGRIAAQ